MASGCLCGKFAGEDLGFSSNCIGNLRVFKDLQPEELSAVAQRALRKIHERGDPIFLQGDRADTMFLISRSYDKSRRFLSRSISRFPSFLLSDSLLSYSFLPLARAISTFTLPSLK